MTLSQILMSGNAHAAAVLSVLWRTSLQGTLFIVLVWAFCRLAPHLSASSRCWLWRLSYLKLALGLFGGAIPIMLPARTTPVRWAAFAPIAIHHSGAGVSAVASANIQGTAIENSHVLPSPELILAALWLIGVLWCAARMLGQWVALRRLIERAAPIVSRNWTDDLAQVAASMGIKRLPALKTSTDIGAPLVAGLLRPIIIVPANQVDIFSPEQRRMTLTHEMAHLRRADLWWSLPTAILTALFCVHPLVWLTRREEELAREEACDMLVLESGGLIAARYAEFLVNLEMKHGRHCPAGSLGMSAGFHLLKRRLQTMKRMITTPVWGMKATVCVLALGAAAALPWSVQAKSKPTETSLLGVWKMPSNPDHDDGRSYDYVAFKPNGVFECNTAHSIPHLFGTYSMKGNRLKVIMTRAMWREGVAKPFHSEQTTRYQLSGNTLLFLDGAKSIIRLTRVGDAGSQAADNKAKPPTPPSMIAGGVIVRFPEIAPGHSMKIEARDSNGRVTTKGYICRHPGDAKTTSVQSLPEDAPVQVIAFIDDAAWSSSPSYVDIKDPAHPESVELRGFFVTSEKSVTFRNFQ
ncbi:MAG: M56 family metallopeptidase [Capsulimonas sp.]|uniref:M56 family metallopeptidase n=1 Tax=Capsulimonas sp. TaxID=2494211 RepID=UPI003267D3C1